MCWMCRDNDDEEQSCVDCGKLICFDTEHDDDICARAAITESGDVYCRPCARQHNAAQNDDDGFQSIDYYVYHDDEDH